MSSSASRGLGENIANKVLGGMPAQRGPAQPAKLNKRGTKAQNSKAGSSSSTGKSAAKSPLMTKNTAAKKVVANSVDTIENAPRSMVLSLYKQLLRRSRSLQYTDRDYFARRMHQEFMKRKDVKDNNLYYIRGKWMLENNMGGLL
jgi:hypothetical protein